MKNKFAKSVLATVTVSLLASCSSSSQAPSTVNISGTQTAATASLVPIEVQSVPGYAIKPSLGNASVTGQLKIPAGLVLSPSDLSSITAPPQGITAPPQGITAPPQGITAPPQGITAPPLGVLPAQSVFGIRSVKSSGLAVGFWAEFFRDNFRLVIPELGQQAFVNNTVLQYINGQPYFVASYVMPKVAPNKTYTVEAKHPLLSLRSTLQTGEAGQTAASDLDLGSTAVDLVKQAAQARNKKVNLAYLNKSLKDLEKVSDALQKRYKNELSESQLQAIVNEYVDSIPAYSEPASIRVDSEVRQLKLKKGETLQLSATTTYANQEKTQAVQWRTLQGDILNVLADGTVLGVKSGSTVLEAISVDNPTLKDQIRIDVY
ncbi:hypothetical protein COW36_21885 [bacterium (Candidatus Blackallbacteria) CG17_big_fil_post_rev_8_21_14_2_50_48_46]|uniref:BIG2 domain-containing protein n=1 Tax=bacterium (Candidatus Blackallbacteria) CG17_big_fil_post_rev_8_21_14_2_50_48_46 TaxID=2014261 RepID=A0A2M7FYW2_9BACT|nr:MAG: hypothetical protein COW64_10980 [bacterium (Candidatus Blackallbacteria) CG18_big_fil_WC_8_21_14_2_50_49_26]PIW14421.1 MAG: hypothetical protein COW36_21885 [bacterium (Candidatus Blackallbacteria) CG17_big_fil_post_rev_8_21_14_2_50_48_46]PIW46927.1 MAG: hypothetical protein COW20_14295 [bacterium (Candidatus Blackallbacteria) CG13_big_fil_rev_8_21_14_2_50_49_14]